MKGIFIDPLVSNGILQFFTVQRSDTDIAHLLMVIGTRNSIAKQHSHKTQHHGPTPTYESSLSDLY